MHAVDVLLEQGFVPRRTVYLAFGHDEEVEGVRGALALKERLKSRGVSLEYVIDEGLMVISGTTSVLRSAVRPTGTLLNRR